MNPSKRKNKIAWVKIKPGCDLPKVKKAPAYWKEFRRWTISDSGNGTNNAFAGSVLLKIDKTIMRGQLIKREIDSEPKWFIEGALLTDLDMFDCWAATG
jgi:hypothetical protein